MFKPLCLHRERVLPGVRGEGIQNEYLDGRTVEKGGLYGSA